VTAAVRFSRVVADLGAIFKAYDIRGIVGEQIDPQNCRAIGAAFARYVSRAGASRIVLGRDMRPDGVGLSAAFASGAVEAGADVVKVMASGGNFTPSSSPRALQYPAAQLAVIVRTAAAAGIDAAAHTHAAAGVRAAVEAGVRHLIHCRWLAADPEGGFDYDPQLAARIADEGIWVNPTIGLGLVAVEARARGEAPPRRNPAMRGGGPTREQGLEIVRDMHSRGVRFTSGLDMGMAYADFDRAAVEAWAFVEQIGFSPWQAIRLMTAQTAEALGLGSEIGAITPGRRADLAAFRGDPAANIRDLSSASHVIQSGRLAAAAG